MTWLSGKTALTEGQGPKRFSPGPQPALRGPDGWHATIYKWLQATSHWPILKRWIVLRRGLETKPRSPSHSHLWENFRSNIWVNGLPLILIMGCLYHLSATALREIIGIMQNNLICKTMLMRTFGNNTARHKCKFKCTTSSRLRFFFSAQGNAYPFWRSIPCLESGWINYDKRKKEILLFAENTWVFPGIFECTKRKKERLMFSFPPKQILWVVLAWLPFLSKG